MKLPEQFQEQMKALLGAEYQDYEESFGQERSVGLRVNRKKISVEDFLDRVSFSLSKVPWTENGFYYREDEPVTRHPYYYAGLYYIQEPSAMMPARCLPVRPGDRVLDLCAAPGGKSTELGARLEGRGLLVSNDISRSRAQALLKNLELFGISNLLVTSETPGKLLGCFPEYFDKILTDVPCSGEGMFRREPGMIKSWMERGPEYYIPIQREILEAAVGMLAPGGMLLYSTCTFNREEDEGNISWLLERHPEMSLEPVEWQEGFSAGFLEHTVRIWPHKVRGEGHFAALLKKKGSVQREVAAAQKSRTVMPVTARRDKAGDVSRQAMSELSEFLDGMSFPEKESGKLEIRGGKAYLLPEAFPALPGIRLLRTGLYLGDLKKERFEPSQALAMCLRAEGVSKALDLPLEDERAIRYLKGETLETDNSRGWILVCTDGFGLGWAKAAGGTLKNKYCAGWRMQ